MHDIPQILKTFLSMPLWTNFDEVLNHPELYPASTIEELSLCTARLYFSGEISYEDGNYIMNSIYNYWQIDHSSNYAFGDIAWECFNAFDSGEWIREEDGPDIDYSEKYTRPRIEKLLQRIENN